MRRKRGRMISAVASSRRLVMSSVRLKLLMIGAARMHCCCSDCACPSWWRQLHWLADDLALLHGSTQCRGAVGLLVTDELYAASASLHGKALGHLLQGIVSTLGLDVRTEQLNQRNRNRGVQRNHIVYRCERCDHFHA